MFRFIKDEEQEDDDGDDDEEEDDDGSDQGKAEDFLSVRKTFISTAAASFLLSFPFRSSTHVDNTFFCLLLHSYETI